MMPAMPDDTLDYQQPRRWAVLAVFSDPLEARMAAAKLEDEGIDTSVGDQRNLMTLYGITLGSAQIGVAEEDFFRAAEILSQTPAKSKLRVLAAAPAAACPKCGLVATHEAPKPSVTAGVLRLLGMGGAKAGEVRCQSCGTVWRPESPG